MERVGVRVRGRIRVRVRVRVRLRRRVRVGLLLELLELCEDTRVALTLSPNANTKPKP